LHSLVKRVYLVYGKAIDRRSFPTRGNARVRIAAVLCRARNTIFFNY